MLRSQSVERTGGKEWGVGDGMGRGCLETRDPRAGPGMTVMGGYIFGRVARRWDIPRVRWRSCSMVSWPYFLM